MIVEIDGKKVYYQRHEGVGTTVVLLHGWGASSQTMSPIFSHLVSKNRNVISIDFLGFGKSDLPPSHFGVYEYAKHVQNFLDFIGISDIILVGHSFGGRVAIVLATLGMGKKIVLVDSAGMKPKRRLSYYIKVYRYKRAKRKNRDVSAFGSSDYKSLQPSMREVFTRVVNQFLERELKKISVPTLIVFGQNDQDTPLYMAKRLRKGIKNSGLVVLKNCGHFSYLDDPYRFNLILDEFIKEPL